MFAKISLSALALTFAASSCALTPSVAPRKLPKLSSAAIQRDTPAPTDEVRPQTKRRDNHSHVFIKLGRQSLDDTAFWVDVNRPVSFGVEADFREADSAIGPEFGFAFSRDGDVFLDFDNDSTNSNFIEVYGGLRITGDFGPRKRLHPYIGGGVTVILAEFEQIVGPIETTDDDVTLGAYAHAGVYYNVSRVVSLGVDGRTVFGTELDLFNAKTDADYTQLSFILGIGF